jgi:hypothetical protein
MSIWRNTLVRRLGFWALLQALPSESALKVYLRSVFLAVGSAVVGSILLGALLTVAMIVVYRLLMINGIEEWIAALTVTGIGLAILVGLIMAFCKAIKTMTQVQDTEEVRETALKSPASRILDAVKAGLQSGYSNT